MVKTLSKFNIILGAVAVFASACALYVRIENFEKLHFENQGYLGVKRGCYTDISKFFSISLKTYHEDNSIICLGESLYNPQYKGKFFELEVIVISIQELQNIADKCSVTPSAIIEFGNIFSNQIISQLIKSKCEFFLRNMQPLDYLFRSGKFIIRDSSPIDFTNFVSYFHSDCQGHDETVRKCRTTAGIFTGYNKLSGRILCILPAEIYSEYNNDELNGKIGEALGKCVTGFKEVRVGIPGIPGNSGDTILIGEFRGQNSGDTILITANSGKFRGHNTN